MTHSFYFTRRALARTWLASWTLLGCSTELERTNAFDALADVSIQARGAVNGYVFLEGETDHAGVEVRFDGPSQTDVSTRADGSFVINELIPGTYRITISERGWQETQTVGEIGLAGQLDIGSTTLPMRRAQVEGLASFADGSTPSEGRIILTRTASLRAPVQSAPIYGAPATSDAPGATTQALHFVFEGTITSGNFVLSGVPNGTYKIQLDILGAVAEDIEITVDGESPVVTLPPIALEPVDITPPDVPVLQLASLDDDEFALSAYTVELRWNQPSDPNLASFELHRFVEGENLDFELLASLPASTLQYEDHIASSGSTHRYRIRAIDTQGNRSPFSLEVLARPFEPIAELYLVEGLYEDITQWHPESGVFQLQGSLLYYDASEDVNTRQDFGVNGLNYAYSLTEDWFNNLLRIRQWNQDSSLLYESDFDLGWPRYDNNISTVPIGFRFESTVDAHGNMHVMYQSGASALSYALENAGQWQYEEVNAYSGGYQISLLVKDDTVHAVNSYSGSPPTPTPPLYYRYGSFGSWSQELVTYGDSHPAIHLADNGDFRVVSRVNRWDPSFYNKVGYYRRLASDGTWKFNELMSLNTSTYLVQREVALTRVGSTNYINYRIESGTSDSWIANTAGEFGSWVTSYPVYIATLTDYDLRRVYDGDEHFLAYENPMTGKLMVLVSSTGASPWTTQEIAADGYSSQYESFAMAASEGVIYLAYLNTTNQLWLAHNAYGTWTRTQLSANPHLSASTSISVEQGRIFVSAGSSSLGATYYSLRTPRSRKVFGDGEIKQVAYDELGRLHILIEPAAGGLVHIWKEGETWLQRQITTHAVASAAMVRYGGYDAVFFHDETDDNLSMYKHLGTAAGTLTTVKNTINSDGGADALVTADGTPHVVIGDQHFKGAPNLSSSWTTFVNPANIVGLRPRLAFVGDQLHLYSSNVYSIGEVYLYHDVFDGAAWSNVHTRVGVVTTGDRPLVLNGSLHASYIGGGSTMLETWNATSGTSSSFLSSQSNVDAALVDSNLSYYVLKRTGGELVFETNVAASVQKTSIANTAGDDATMVLDPANGQPVAVFRNGGIFVLENFARTAMASSVLRATTF